MTDNGLNAIVDKSIAIKPGLRTTILITHVLIRQCAILLLQVIKVGSKILLHLRTNPILDLTIVILVTKSVNNHVNGQKRRQDTTTKNVILQKRCKSLAKSPSVCVVTKVSVHEELFKLGTKEGTL